jgi:hypothetical protein
VPAKNSARANSVTRDEQIAARIRNAGKPRRLKPRCCPKPFRAKPKPEGYVFGRPTLYRPEYCERVIELMGRGYDLTAFAGAIGVSREAVYAWMDAHADFQHAVNIGKAGRLFALQTKLLTTKMGVGVTAAIFALKNAAPDDWQDRYNQQTEIKVTVQHLSDAQLYEIASKAKPVTIDAQPVPMVTHANPR